MFFGICLFFFFFFESAFSKQIKSNAFMMSPIHRSCHMVMIFDTESVFFVHCKMKSLSFECMSIVLFEEIKYTNLVIRLLSRKLGEPRRLGIDGDRDDRLHEKYLFLFKSIFRCYVVVNNKKSRLTAFSHLCYYYWCYHVSIVAMNVFYF